MSSLVKPKEVNTDIKLELLSSDSSMTPPNPNEVLTEPPWLNER
jgi:hypothetical protein